MNFVADENIDRQIEDRLRADGHKVRPVAEMEPGISDEVILNKANQENAILLTADKDFGELVFRQRRLSQGVILVRLAGLSPASKSEVVASVLDQHQSELPHSFTVITPSTIRIRHQID